MSEIGSVLQFDLTFPTEDAAKYLNVTNSDLLWSSEAPQTIVSAVCKGQYVFFGSKSPGSSSHVLRLDILDSNPSTRFFSLGAVAKGDLTFARLFGDNILFAMEPDVDVPLSFVVVSNGDTPAVEVSNSNSLSLSLFLSFFLKKKNNNNFFL